MHTYICIHVFLCEFLFEIRAHLNIGVCCEQKLETVYHFK